MKSTIIFKYLPLSQVFKFRSILKYVWVTRPTLMDVKQKARKIVETSKTSTQINVKETQMFGNPVW